MLDNSVSLDSPNNDNGATNLKNCIIKLTDLSAEERNKWLGLMDTDSVSNLSTDSSSTRYYMRMRTDPPKNNKRPTRKSAKPTNYHESPPSRELDDSDYEPKAKCEKPLDNKRYPSNTRIAIQKTIEENKIANKGLSAVLDGVIKRAVIETDGTEVAKKPALLDTTDVPDVMPNASSNILT